MFSRFFRSTQTLMFIFQSQQPAECSASWAGQEGLSRTWTSSPSSSPCFPGCSSGWRRGEGPGWRSPRATASTKHLWWVSAAVSKLSAATAAIWRELLDPAPLQPAAGQATDSLELLLLALHSLSTFCLLAAGLFYHCFKIHGSKSLDGCVCPPMSFVCWQQISRYPSANKLSWSINE